MTTVENNFAETLANQITVTIGVGQCFNVVAKGEPGESAPDVVRAAVEGLGKALPAFFNEDGTLKAAVFVRTPDNNTTVRANDQTVIPAGSQVVVDEPKSNG